jgi:magnesium-transporting ATPase (P-type)
VVLAILAILPWLGAVSSGVADRSAFAYLLFAAMTFAVAAVNLFSIGTAFNYVVGLFYRRPIRQGLLGRPLLNNPLEMKFGTIGAIFLVIALVMFIAALIISPATPAWFLLVPSAMFAITGIQLGTMWMLIKMLSELSSRETKAAGDLVANDAASENVVIVRRNNDVKKVSAEVNKAMA